MPYDKNEDLPDNIKKTLPVEAQDIFRNAFNSAYKASDNEEICNKKAWGAVKNAGYEKGGGEKWIKKEKESFTIKNVEIFAVGTWKGDKYTANDLDEIAENFTLLKNEIKPMMHIGHDRALENDGQPAIGWIDKVKRKGEKLFVDLVDVPKIVYNAIKKKLYKRISSEICWGVKHSSTNKKYGKVLTGVALIGSAIPAVRTLQDLSIFTLDMDERKSYSFNVKDGTIGGDNMPQDEMKKYIEDLKEANKKADEALNKAKEYKEKLDEMEAQKIADDKNRSIGEIKKYCEDQVKAGKLSPAARDIIIKDIDKKTYTENDKFNFSFDQVKDILEKQYTIDMDEKGTSTKAKKYDSPDAQVEAQVKKHMKDNKLTYTEAMQDLLDTDEAFAKTYSEMKYSDEE